MNVRHTMVGEMSSCGNAVVGKCSVRKVSPEGKSQGSIRRGRVLRGKYNLKTAWIPSRSSFYEPILN